MDTKQQQQRLTPEIMRKYLKERNDTCILILHSKVAQKVFPLLSSFDHLLFTLQELLVDLIDFTLTKL